ncbi:DUF1294 domain-containing protein [Pseudomonas sp. BN411]|nr:DUF1294 domain-containing protein [Pseudomonas sp. BN411]
MIRRLAPASLLFALGSAQAEVYRCIQADGVVRYTDQGCGSLEGSRPLASPDAVEQLLQTATNGLNQWVQPLLGGAAPWKLLLAVYLLMSLICFVAYWRDKRLAVAGEQRTPESRLHLYELLGGWPGGLLAQRLIRHKNRKVAYQVKFWLIVAVHLGLLGYWVLH